ncbi:MAG: hypothetical protein AMXMBFR58_29580 [Phycisphaerae bacterium]
MARTLTQQLDDLDAAIAQIEQGCQRYTMPNGQTVERANLADLYTQRRQLQGELAQASSGGMFTRVSFRSGK